MKRIIPGILLLLFAAGLNAADVPVAGFLPDPGFERSHLPNAQLNAPGTKEINGWSARPEKGNFWTSVSYVDRGGKTLADHRPALAPAEGNSYLRMFTLNSSSWLALRSPEFQVTNGTAYSVAFDIAADRSTPMAEMQIYLEVNWKKYGEETRDLIHLAPGWNTIVYRTVYRGPTGKGRLVIRGVREKNAKGGSLNFDHFRAPAAKDIENAAGRKQAEPQGAEAGGLRQDLPLQKSALSIPVVPLRRGIPSSFQLRAEPGRYHLLVKVKSSDRSGNEGDTMFGGYDYLMPDDAYSFSLDGHSLVPRISGRMAEVVERDARGNGICTGWLYFRDPVEIRPGSALTVSCSKADGFLTQIVLMNDAQWKAEELRMSNLFHSPPGRGAGNAWYATVARPRLVYPVDSLRYFLKGLDTFCSRAKNSSGFSPLAAAGKALADRTAAFVSRKQLPPGDAADGAKLAADWEAYRKTLFSDFSSRFSAGMREKTEIAEKILKTVNPDCHAGREAAFYADIARTYFSAARQNLKAFPAGSTQDFTFFTQVLTDLDNGARYLKQAQEWAGRPQTTVDFPRFFVERNPALPPGRIAGTERLLLSGIWQFAPGNPDRMPGNWMKVPIPNDSPFVFYNPANISDREFGRESGAYWQAGRLRNLWFRTDFQVPADWNGESISLKFGEVMMAAEVFLNGRFAGSHCGGLIPFELDITKFAVPGKTNHLAVYVSSAEKTAMGDPSPIPRFHGLKAHYLYPVAESHVYGLRISGNVELIAKPAVRAENVYIRTSVRHEKITVLTTLVNDTESPVEVKLNAVVRDGARSVLPLPERKVSIPAGNSVTVESEASFPHPKLWGIGGQYGDPHNRYALVSTVTADGRRSTECTPFAFREVEIRGRKLFLNGKEFQLQGTSTSVTERVTVRNNKEAELFLNRARKKANINFIRYHRFNLHDWLVAACDDAGILCEGEGPWWDLFAPTDINGNNNYDDPVWLANCREYYQKIMRKFRNAPSMLFFSLENETLDADNHRAIAKFRKWAQAEAPHMILMNHSHASATLPEAPVAVLHDYDLGLARIADFSRFAKKPVVIGEFWNPEISKALQNPQQARGAERVMRIWLTRAIRAYRKAGADGVMPYTFTGLGGISSQRDQAGCGPWSALYMARPQKVFALPVSWPADSGNAGIHSRKIWLDYMTMRAPVNFFDPSRHACTPTGVVDAYREAFQPVPQNPVRRSPELLVEVKNGAAPLAGVNVFARSGDSDRRGVKADAQGRAWFFFDLPGKYLITVNVNGKELRKEVELNSLPLDRPGWAYLPRLRFDAANGTAEFIPGKTFEAEAGTHSPEIVKPAVSPSLKQPAGNRPAVGPSGFIRRWLMLGPFPNYGSRKNLKVNGLDHDFLGGEAQAEPSVKSAPVKAEFKTNPEAYWEPCMLTLRWKPFVSSSDKVNLSDAYLVNRPGLDGGIQYVFGYAACYVYSDAAQNAVLTIGSDDGFKLWLNHRPVGELRAYRGCKLDENRFPVTLRKGWNPLLVKIEQGSGGYEFALRFLSPTGKPLLVKTSLNPSEKVPVAAIPGGIVRDWMLLGPFPSAGSRPDCVGLSTDFLGNEAAAQPDGREYRASFPVYEKAYYSAGTMVNRWKAHHTADGTVNLGEALLRPEVPGLDVSPIQYVTAYAFATVSAPRSGEYELRVLTFNGIRVWVNGKEVIDDSRQTFNRDPNSPLLPPSHEKELTCRVPLNKGENRILVKSAVDYGPFHFSLKLNR